MKVVAVMGEPPKRVTDGLKGLFVALTKAGAIEKHSRLATPENPEPAFLRLVLRNTGNDITATVYCSKVPSINFSRMLLLLTQPIYGRIAVCLTGLTATI